MFKKFFFVVLTMLVLQGCDSTEDDILPEEPKGTTALTITGAISANISHDGVEFTHTAIQAQKSTGLQITIGNIGTTESAVVINLLDLDNGQLFAAGTYTYSGDPNATLIMTAIYLDDTNGYSIDPDAVNKIILTEVKNTSVKGEIDLNLIDQNLTGDKINIKGTFEAIGFTVQQ